jgi:AAA+ ATPase superfamily predicted ATPase
MFVDREQELARLEELYRLDRADLVVIYGRRRVGKSALLRRFCEDKPNLFFVATLASDAEQLASFSQEVQRLSLGQADEGFTYPTWEAAFRALARLPGRPVVVLDEFTYLISGNGALPSILQKVWDETLSETHIFLVLCGSYMGMMEREVLGYGAPLYGRRTGGFQLRSLPLGCVPQFFPHYGREQQIEAWAVLGGMPYYLLAFSDRRDLFANIAAQVLDGNGLLRYEPQLALLQELRDPRNYFSVLRAIAQGKTRINEIAQHSGLREATTAVRYLDVLRQLHLVRRDVPVTEEQPEKSRKGIYRLDDHFMRFWFRYVHPHQGALEAGRAQMVLDQVIAPDFDAFVGPAFEEAALGHLVAQADAGALPFVPERIGGWWGAGEEIDIVALNDRAHAMLLAECKWSARPVGPGALYSLRAKTIAIDPQRRWPGIYYALYSRSGFTGEMQDLAQAEGVRLVSAADLLPPSRAQG